MSDRDIWAVSAIVWGFLMGGIAMVCFAVYSVYRRMRLVANSLTATGTVVRVNKFRRGPTGERDTFFRPIVQFTAPDGSAVEFADPFFANVATHRVGDAVCVLYDPDDPARARIAGFYRLYLAPAALLFIGVIWVWLAAPMVQHLPRSENAAAPRGAILERFVGRWSNEDPETRSITRLEIRPQLKGLAVQMWGKCSPVECDWGAPQSINLAHSDQDVIELGWRTSFATRKQTVTLLSAGRLKVVTDTHFTIPAGRQDYVSTEYFKPARGD